MAGQPEITHKRVLKIAVPVVLSNATVPFFGFDLLANPVVLTLGTFQGVAGREALAVPVPAGIGYVTLFSQIVAGSPAGAVSGVSNFSLTIAQ